MAQRIYALAHGYEDLNDYDELRHDPLMALRVGKTDPAGERRRRSRDRGKALAGKSTLNRLELTPSAAVHADRYMKIVLDDAAAERLFVDLLLQAHQQPPESIVLDLDATDDPLYGQQEVRFFHSYYTNYCYLVLYIFCGEFLLCAKLRAAWANACSRRLGLPPEHPARSDRRQGRRLVAVHDQHQYQEVETRTLEIRQ